MRNVTVSEFVTLDGVMEDPGGAEKFAHGGWTWPYMNEEIGKFKLDELFASDALPLGRMTYQGFAGAWPSRTDEAGFCRQNEQPPQVRCFNDIGKGRVEQFKVDQGKYRGGDRSFEQQPGQDILIAGSGVLVRTLMQHDRIDEYRLLVYPVVLGSGKRLFKDGSHTTLRLVEAKTFGSGVVLFQYHRAPG